MTTFRCLVCRTGIDVRAATGRKSGKLSIQLVCPIDPRHFRAFIHDREFIDKVIAGERGDA